MAVAQVTDGVVEVVGADPVAAGRADERSPHYLKVDVDEGDRARDAPRWRLRPEVQARLRLRGGLARARDRRPGARAVDARGRPAEQLLPHRRGAPARGRARRARAAVVAWLHRSAYPAISATFAPDVTGPDADELTNGASDIPYAIPNMSVEVCPAVAHTRIGWYRSVNAIHHGFAIGSFVDELAHAAGKDPLQFLLALIGPDRQVDLSKAGLVAPASNYGALVDRLSDGLRPRASACVRLAAEKCGWGSTLPEGKGPRHRDAPELPLLRRDGRRGRGARPTAPCSCPRATVAVDAGFVANPDRARAQMEGALVMAMSNTLYSEITFAEGKVVQSNFRDYDVTRMRAAPHVVDVHLVESEGLPGGIGEPGVPPAGAALANAIHAATGVRVRELPVGKQLAGWRDRKA